MERRTSWHAAWCNPARRGVHPTPPDGRLDALFAVVDAGRHWLCHVMRLNLARLVQGPWDRPQDVWLDVERRSDLRPVARHWSLANQTWLAKACGVDERTLEEPVAVHWPAIVPTPPSASRCWCDVRPLDLSVRMTEGSAPPTLGHVVRIRCVDRTLHRWVSVLPLLRTFINWPVPVPLHDVRRVRPHAALDAREAAAFQSILSCPSPQRPFVTVHPSVRVPSVRGWGGRPPRRAPALYNVDDPEDVHRALEHVLQREARDRPLMVHRWVPRGSLPTALRLRCRACSTADRNGCFTT
jgi:hypothetical protein